MPNDNPEIVTGMRAPHHTGQVAKPMIDVSQTAEPIRRVALREGQVEFHSVNKRYRVEFQKPKQQLNQTTGEVIEEGARFLQFEGYRCATENPTLIHQAKGCVNIPGAMVPHAHTPTCAKNCAIQRCAMGHQNPRNSTQYYFPAHPSCRIRGDFWDAAEMDAILTKNAKAKLLEDINRLKATIPENDMPDFLTALGVNNFNLPPKEATK